MANNEAILQRLRESIEAAHELAASGKVDLAVEHFAFARSLIRPSLDPVKLRRITAGHFSSLENESSQYRELLFAQSQAQTEIDIVVASDSLGLPRVDEKNTKLKGLETTFPFHLQKSIPESKVHNYSRRYHVSTDIVNKLQNDLDLGRDAHFVFHVGLNDCSRRMFSEEDRLALAHHTENDRELVVTFAQKYRRQILRLLPPLQYVTPDQYRTNLSSIYSLLQQRECRGLYLVTTILPPLRFWAGTPHMAKFFAEFNQILYDFAWENGVELIDFDRIVWERQSDGLLLSDGMHLAHPGHQALAEEISKQIKARG